MNPNPAHLTEAHAGDAVFCSAADRILLHLILIAGYAFLGFFGWLLTL
jgi:hypothetical protein